MRPEQAIMSVSGSDIARDRKFKSFLSILHRYRAMTFLASRVRSEPNSLIHVMSSSLVALIRPY